MTLERLRREIRCSGAKKGPFGISGALCLGLAATSEVPALSDSLWTWISSNSCLEGSGFRKLSSLAKMFWFHPVSRSRGNRCSLLTWIGGRSDRFSETALNRVAPRATAGVDARPSDRTRQGPALWIFNNAQFSSKDFDSICRLGVGGKRDQQRPGMFLCSLFWSVAAVGASLPSFGRSITWMSLLRCISGSQRFHLDRSFLGFHSHTDRSRLQENWSLWTWL